jgi:hypothetical protein
VRLAAKASKGEEDLNALSELKEWVCIGYSLNESATNADLAKTTHHREEA